MTDRHVTFAWLAQDPAASDERTWRSAEHPVPFGATAVVASWHAETPPGSWVEPAVRGRAEDGDWSPWLTLARWAETDDTTAPTSVPDEGAEGARVATDEVRIDPTHAWTRVQARVRLAGSGRPVLHRLGLLASRVPATAGPVSTPALGRPVTIDVPARSQMLHRDRHPEFGGGGQAWCSPTSLTMVLDHFGALPDPDAYDWVDEGPDRVVAHVARRCYDSAYAGAGNWSFNAAYANTRGLEAFVTRLRSLAEAEQLVAAGIPPVISVSFTADELDGAGYGTDGHLMTLVGFTGDGDPVVNDPASHEEPDSSRVRTTYDRAQLERAWLTGSGGIAYVVRPADRPLPPPPAEANW